MKTKRREGIEIGVRNAVDTVVVDKEMTRDEAYSMLKDFVSDGLSCAGLSDRTTSTDMKYARAMWPL